VFADRNDDWQHNGPQGHGNDHGGPQGPGPQGPGHPGNGPQAPVTQENTHRVQTILHTYISKLSYTAYISKYPNSLHIQIILHSLRILAI